MDDFPAKQKEYGATIGVITVPVEKAQEVTDRIIEGGIKALWNFIPVPYTGAGTYRSPEYFYVCAFSCYV